MHTSCHSRQRHWLRQRGGGLQEGERKARPPTKESPEELAECEEVFAEF